MKKLTASLALAFSLLTTPPAYSWSLHEAHIFGNDVLVQVGDWCSGTVIDKAQGLVVTAAHCAKGFHTVVNTRKETSDGKTVNVAIHVPTPQTLTIESFTDRGDLYKRAKYKAILMGKDEANDVAILKITTSLKGLKGQARLSPFYPKFGDIIYTITNPMLIPNVVTTGYITKPKVEVPVKGISDTPIIQFSAVIAPGSSGGGLYNDSGELIGITNWGTNGLFWAAPVSNVTKLLSTLHLTLAPSS